MNQLTVGALREAIKGLPASTVIYLGDDEELNGIHEAFFAQEITDDDVSTYSDGSLTANDKPNVKRLMIS